MKQKGYEILYLSDDVDEFVMNILQEYDGKPFKSLNQGDLDLDSEEEKKEREEKEEANKDLLSALTAELKDKVKEVRLSSRLMSHPVCLVADAGVSLEMEKVFGRMPDNPGVKAEKILEINSDHPVFAALQKAYEEDKNTFGQYASLLYDQALLIEGFSLEDPLSFSNSLCDLMVRANKS